uniref:Core protein VP7 n=1 Tax=Bluetongue virus 15 TaxID=35331 RepID=Q65753_BTV|nr:major core protein VP7 [Bluetongue virus 15]
MDTIAARALTVMRSCVTLQDARIVLEANVMEILGIAINRYNGLTLRGVTMRPTSQAQKNDMFFMCLDMMLSAAGINLGPISPDYQQHMGTIGVLATPEVPFTTECANEVARVAGETSTWGPARQAYGFFLESEEVFQPGRWFMRPAQAVTPVICGPDMIQVSMNAGARADIQQIFQGRNDPMMIYIIWRRIEIFANAQGNSVQTQAGVTVSIGGVNIRAGRITAWDGQAALNVHNPTAANAMIQIQVVFYVSMDKTLNQYPALASEIYNIYSFRDPTWHALRMAILNRTTLPGVLPPIFPPADRESVIVLLLLSTLADVYTVLKPEFIIHGVAPIVGQITRAIARAAYV